ncbi:hypothetical protein [Streptomyces alboviridis]|uniref:Uncharacterized protein n=1 Tax=Streptomyces microflavus TaxID=1919 RepID=A0A7J0CTY5_STRMI|nr:hypothetical protein [Streptomyces alboviridis]GFN05923.1 hypothetical protein Smic_44790 [Streptomyces microflavus]
MPGRRWWRCGRGRLAAGDAVARPSGHEPVAQLPVPRAAAARRDADGAADAEQHVAGGAGVVHQDQRSWGPAHDGGAFGFLIVHIDRRGDIDALMAGLYD